MVSDRIKWSAATIAAALPALIMTWNAPDVANWPYTIAGALLICVTGPVVGICGMKAYLS